MAGNLVDYVMEKLGIEKRDYSGFSDVINTIEYMEESKEINGNDMDIILKALAFLNIDFKERKNAIEAKRNSKIIRDRYEDEMDSSQDEPKPIFDSSDYESDEPTQRIRDTILFYKYMPEDKFDGSNYEYIVEDYLKMWGNVPCRDNMKKYLGVMFKFNKLVPAYAREIGRLATPQGRKEAIEEYFKLIASMEKYGIPVEESDCRLESIVLMLLDIKGSSLTTDFLMSLPYAKQKYLSVIYCAILCKDVPPKDKKRQMCILYNLAYRLPGIATGGNIPNEYLIASAIAYERQITNIKDDRRHAFELVETIKKMRYKGGPNTRYFTKAVIESCCKFYSSEKIITTEMLKRDSVRFSLQVNNLNVKDDLGVSVENPDVMLKKVAISKLKNLFNPQKDFHIVKVMDNSAIEINKENFLACKDIINYKIGSGTDNKLSVEDVEFFVNNQEVLKAVIEIKDKLGDKFMINKNVINDIKKQKIQDMIKSDTDIVMIMLTKDISYIRTSYPNLLDIEHHLDNAKEFLKEKKINENLLNLENLRLFKIIKGKIKEKSFKSFNKIVNLYKQDKYYEELSKTNYDKEVLKEFVNEINSIFFNVLH